MRQCRADRMEHAKRFRAMLAELGLSHLDAAKLLHISLRTLQNWLSGRHEVPYASYKLLRLLRHAELPGDAWRGWSFSRGLLITPEGRTIAGHEGSWWSLLVRRAAAFDSLYGAVQRSAAVARDAQAAAAVPAPAAEGAGAARSAANLLLEHFGTRERQNPVNSPFIAINTIVKPFRIMKGGLHG